MEDPNTKKRAALQGLLLLMPLALLLFFFASHPFKDELVVKVFSLSNLSPEQQFNIALAAHALNGQVIKPGQQFSFNQALGPRSDGRGYRPAPSYLGPGSPSTVGGGICLVSSALYQAALAAGLDIDERTAHTRTIGSVVPGLDATVWYGKADLKFTNNSKQALQIKSECRNHNLYLSLLTERKTLNSCAELKTFVACRTRKEILVEVFRELGGKREFVSRDHYLLN